MTIDKRNMATITLEGMTFFAHHGYYVHEQERGNRFIVHIEIDTDIEQAALYDDLQLTVNYEAIYQVTAMIMEEPCRLIETVAYRIAHAIRKQFPDLASVRVSLRKLNPELGGPVESARVTYAL